MISFKKFDSLFGAQLQGSLGSEELYSVLSFCNRTWRKALVSVGFSGVRLAVYFGTVSFCDDGCVVIDCGNDDHVELSPPEIVGIEVKLIA